MAADPASSSLNASVSHGGAGNPGDEISPLQKHAMFFDINGDGLIYPWETFKGFRMLGFGIPLSTFAAVFINLGLSKKTRPGKGISLLFPIEVKNIKLGKHTSDTGVYDSDGRFVPEKFEEIFAEHAHSSANSLTSKELDEMLKANRLPKDYAGWVGAWAEWKVLYLLAKDKDGVLPKEAIKGVYDGSLFETIKKQRTAKNVRTISQH
ncbi:unnamed protein product [Cuscuta europaea]|uniref:Peroxygenase 4 n=1 Tax=Cuscuta europaea TaxID=41803 RepID=A0A9P0ZAM0_CUSEU|nr:unnamed protein product [Cuscuta europaea]